MGAVWRCCRPWRGHWDMSLRNEPNCGGRGFSFSVLRGGLQGGRRRLRLRLEAFGLDGAQFFDGLALQAVGVIDAALKAGLGLGRDVEGLAGWAVGAGVVGVFHYVDQDLGIDSVEAAEEPGGADDVVDQGALDDGLRLAILVEPFGEGGESGGILAGDDARFSVNSGLESIHAGSGLALGGAWAGGVLGVATITFDLILCAHKKNGQRKSPIVAFPTAHSQVNWRRGGVLALRL